MERQRWKCFFNQCVVSCIGDLELQNADPKSSRELRESVIGAMPHRHSGDLVSAHTDRTGLLLSLPLNYIAIEGSSSARSEDDCCRVYEHLAASNLSSETLHASARDGLHWITYSITHSLAPPRSSPFPPSWLRPPSQLLEIHPPSQSDRCTDHYYGSLRNLQTTTSENMLNGERRTLSMNTNTSATSGAYKSLCRKG